MLHDLDRFKHAEVDAAIYRDELTNTVEWERRAQGFTQAAVLDRHVLAEEVKYLRELTAWCFKGLTTAHESCNPCIPTPDWHSMFEAQREATNNEGNTIDEILEDSTPDPTLDQGPCSSLSDSQSEGSRNIARWEGLEDASADACKEKGLEDASADACKESRSQEGPTQEGGKENNQSRYSQWPVKHSGDYPPPSDS